MTLVYVLAALAVIANVCAVCSGWAVLFANPEILRSTQGRWANAEPAFLCYALVMLTTALAMFLSLLLTWWFIDSTIHTTVVAAALIFMTYHALTGVVTTVVHLFIGVIAGAVPKPPERGAAHDLVGKSVAAPS